MKRTDMSKTARGVFLSTPEHRISTSGVLSVIKKVLSDFNAANIRYCVLRNYEFLLDKKQQPGFDFDVSISSEDKSKAESIFYGNGFIKKPKQFSRKHQGYAAFSPEDLKKVGFDIQWDGVVWNDMYYLDSSIYSRRKKAGLFYVVSDEDAFILYLCHSILGKRFFKEKYMQKLSELSSKNLNFSIIEQKLDKVFKARGIGKKLIYLIKTNSFDKIMEKKYSLIVKFILWKHLPFFTILFFRWFKEKVIPHRLPLIAIIGPDGSGKSTTVEAITKVLQNNEREVAQVYLGRGKSHLLPINKPGMAVYNKIKASRSKTLTKLIYYLAAPVYTLDLLLRYFFIALPKRKRFITITDRYGTDIYLMPKISNFFRSFLFSLFPKPTLTFYLYNDAKTLYSRKRQQSVPELEWQLSMFDKMASKLHAHRIKTDSKEAVLRKISTIIFEYLAKKGF